MIPPSISWRRTSVSGMRLLCTLLALALQLPCHAAAIPPQPRLARTLRPDQIARLLRAAPAEARVSAPIIMPLPWRPGWYTAGQAALHAGGTYICLQSHAALDNWTPDAVPALWRLIRAPDDPATGPPAWRQPLGAHDAYHLGDIVTHAGHTWRSTINNNVWEPGIYGWEKL